MGGHVGREGQGGGAITGAPWAAWQGGVRGWVPAPCGQVLPKSGGWCSVLRCSWVWMLPARTTGRGGRVQSVPAKPEPVPWKTLVSPEGPFWWGALIPSVSKHPLLPRGTQGPEMFPKLGPQPESVTLCQMTAKTGSVLGEGLSGTFVSSALGQRRGDSVGLRREDREDHVLFWGCRGSRPGQQGRSGMTQSVGGPRRPGVEQWMVRRQGLLVTAFLLASGLHGPCPPL